MTLTYVCVRFELQHTHITEKQSLPMKICVSTEESLRSTSTMIEAVQIVHSRHICQVPSVCTLLSVVETSNVFTHCLECGACTLKFVQLVPGRVYTVCLLMGYSVTNCMHRISAELRPFSTCSLSVSMGGQSWNILCWHIPPVYA